MKTSILSIRSEGSILSIGSRGSVLSIGSVGSVLSVGSIGSFASAFSIGSFASVASILSAAADRSVLSGARAGPSSAASFAIGFSWLEFSRSGVRVDGAVRVWVRPRGRRRCAERRRASAGRRRCSWTGLVRRSGRDRTAARCRCSARAGTRWPMRPRAGRVRGGPRRRYRRLSHDLAADEQADPGVAHQPAPRAAVAHADGRVLLLHGPGPGLGRNGQRSRGAARFVRGGNRGGGRCGSGRRRCRGGRRGG